MGFKICTQNLDTANKLSSSVESGIVAVNTMIASA